MEKRYERDQEQYQGGEKGLFFEDDNTLACGWEERMREWRWGRLRSCLDSHKYTRTLSSEASKNILYCGSTWEAVKGQNCHKLTGETGRKIKHEKCERKPEKS